MLKRFKVGARVFLSYLVASPTDKLRETVEHLQGVNTKLFEMYRETLAKLMEAHGKVFILENRLAHTKKYAEEREAAHRQEVAELMLLVEKLRT